MALTVKQLIAQLGDMSPDTLVVLQKDSEGNGYRHANGADRDTFVKASDRGEYFLDVINEDDRDDDEDYIQVVTLY